MATAYKPTAKPATGSPQSGGQTGSPQSGGQPSQHAAPTGGPQRADQRDDKQDARRDARSDDRRDRIENRDQDPNHPANKTPPYRGDATPRPVAEGVTVPPEEMLTEQEKDAAAGGPATDGNVPGVGPAPSSEVTTGPVETVEDQGIGPRTPYPTGDPPDTAESRTFSQGIKGVTDKPSAKPGSSSGPANQAPGVHDRNRTYEANKPKEPAR